MDDSRWKEVNFPNIYLRHWAPWFALDWRLKSCMTAETDPAFLGPENKRRKKSISRFLMMIDDWPEEKSLMSRLSFPKFPGEVGEDFFP